MLSTQKDSNVANGYISFSTNTPFWFILIFTILGAIIEKDIRTIVEIITNIAKKALCKTKDVTTMASDISITAQYQSAVLSFLLYSSAFQEILFSIMDELYQTFIKWYNTQSMNKKIIVANWKMNPMSVGEAKEIVTELKNKSKGFGDVCLVICPPFIFLNEVSTIISSSKKIILGAQDVFIGQGVSHTGEVGVGLLKKVCVKYILVGHSERRVALDNDEVVKEKMLGSLKAGFKTILCVGEKERNEHGDHYHEVKKQIEDAIVKLPKKLIKDLVIAYEPVWAIGRPESEAMKPDQLHEMTIFIKRLISDTLGTKEVSKIKILYGGSVTKNNAKEIVEKGNVDGLLIGRESLKLENFLELIKEIK